MIRRHGPRRAGFSLVDSYYQVPRADAPEFKDCLVSIVERERLAAIYVCSPTELAPMSAGRWNMSCMSMTM